MAFRVDLAPRALRDLSELTRYIQVRGGHEQAQRWLEGILEKVASLRTMAARHPIAPESADLGVEVRVLFHGGRNRGYKVYYSIHEQTGTVRVLHVRHWARRPVKAQELRRLAEWSDS
jgi:plasmid stabilization system protein ParE